ncbi:MAG TPA: hypothetical protein VK508_18235 [Cyclobacteriaceae bacterium]|nr:hypothetical protein [Cyclobacteriaceae bacterium]
MAKKLRKEEGYDKPVNALKPEVEWSDLIGLSLKTSPKPATKKKAKKK